MAIITVQLYPGRSVQQKRDLVRALTDAVVAHAGATRERCYVVLQEVPPENWGVLGTYALDDEATTRRWAPDGTPVTDERSNP
ncbi:hypothetical protein BJF78_19480 [Pseudonocardia sp. CNS-139]|nr:hypothetical protein BJF78_19480 [Pseudonocardia sp. CNS-139]